VFGGRVPMPLLCPLQGPYLLFYPTCTLTVFIQYLAVRHHSAQVHQNNTAEDYE
jgi:hypothetical protein